jgi:signal transduction histidine kinase
MGSEHQQLREIAVPADADAPRTVRHVLAGWLAGGEPEAVVDDVLVVASELVTNSVRHAGIDQGTIWVRLRAGGQRLRLEVQDDGTGGAVAVLPPDPDRASGFGLSLVAAVARDWGVVRHGGTVVWAELGRPG